MQYIYQIQGIVEDTTLVIFMKYEIFECSQSNSSTYLVEFYENVEMCKNLQFFWQKLGSMQNWKIFWNT